jgi:hypothetical protein
MSTLIRPLEDADHEAWGELFRAYIRFCEAQVPGEVIALAWQRLLKQEDGRCGPVLGRNGPDIRHTSLQGVTLWMT